MEVFLIRHTTPKLTPGLIYGRREVDLTDTFPVEMAIIKSQIPLVLDAVFSSPSKRCTLLAQEIDAQFNIDDRLMEFDFGLWEGQTWDTVDGDDLSKWTDDFVNEVVPGGESMMQMHARVSDFIETLRASSFKSVAVITHGGVIRLISAIQNNLPMDRVFDLKVDFGAMIRITLG